jgi:hypothetical protein
MDIKNIHDVKDTSSMSCIPILPQPHRFYLDTENTIEIINRFWAATGEKIVANIYHLKTLEDKQLVLDFIIPLLPKKVLPCALLCSTNHFPVCSVR